MTAEQQMDSSLFAILRVLAAAIACDGEIKAREEKWFQWLIGRYDLSPKQISTLEADLQSPPDPAPLIEDIRVPQDRQRLRDWLVIATEIDTELNSAERTFLSTVQAQLEAKPAFKMDSYTDELVQYANRQVFYADLEELGDSLRQRSRFSNPYWALARSSGIKPLALIAAVYLIAFVVTATLQDFERYKRSKAKREIATRLHAFCQRSAPCPAALAASSKCVDASWPLTNSSGGHYRPELSERAGFHPSQYVSCINNHAGRPIFTSPSDISIFEGI